MRILVFIILSILVINCANWTNYCGKCETGNCWKCWFKAQIEPRTFTRSGGWGGGGWGRSGSSGFSNCNTGNCSTQHIRQDTGNGYGSFRSYSYSLNPDGGLYGGLNYYNGQNRVVDPIRFLFSPRSAIPFHSRTQYVYIDENGNKVVGRKQNWFEKLLNLDPNKDLSQTTGRNSIWRHPEQIHITIQSDDSVDYINQQIGQGGRGRYERDYYRYGKQNDPQEAHYPNHSYNRNRYDYYDGQNSRGTHPKPPPNQNEGTYYGHNRQYIQENKKRYNSNPRNRNRYVNHHQYGEPQTSSGYVYRNQQQYDDEQRQQNNDAQEPGENDDDRYTSIKNIKTGQENYENKDNQNNTENNQNQEQNQNDIGKQGESEDNNRAGYRQVPQGFEFYDDPMRGFFDPQGSVFGSRDDSIFGFRDNSMFGFNRGNSGIMDMDDEFDEQFKEDEVKQDQNTDTESNQGDNIQNSETPRNGKPTIREKTVKGDGYTMHVRQVKY